MLSPRARTSSTVSCDLGDGKLVELDDWRWTIDQSYEIRRLGQWQPIESWKITTGKAITWYDAGREDQAEEAW